jgi:DEAD/DEAH box helicase domain-containing protein
MLSLQQAYEVKVSIIEYLKATYSFQDKEVEKAFLRLVENENDGMFKGPYISLKLPYKKFEGDLDNLNIAIRPRFRPFVHQAVVFDRLSTNNNHQPLPTVLTTGTASGKTEAFLYPIIDYCFNQKERKGIKAIILYPMNALATDQAQRIAEAIYSDDRTRGKITAGLFIGKGQDNDKKYPKEMGEKNIIELRDTILSNPPDILLTNFKMLDYALMRNIFHDLWEHNFEDTSLLKFLVLDELHTYDGAQGTDVANLIRRLKLKLGVEKGQICPVGTSATIGSGDNAPLLLADYAKKVFGEEFNEDSIIGETRIDADEFFKDIEFIKFIPTDFLLSQSRIKGDDTYQSYIQKQLTLLGINPKISNTDLGSELKKYRIVYDVLNICKSGIIDFKELIIELVRVNADFKQLSDWSKEYNFSPKETLIRSILTLISEAKVQEEKKESPLLYVQVQLWIRELSGILRLFQDDPVFSWKDSVSTDEKIKALPPYFCRECGTSGWATVKHDNRNIIEDDISDTYQKYFSNHKNLYFTNAHKEEHIKIDEYQPSDTLDNYVDVNTFGLYNEEKKNRFRTISYRKIIGTKADHVCPICNSRNTIAIIGTKTATLSSITISQVISSELDKTVEKNRKVLAFTNGVQDAAHQAGFIEARNYRFTFRSAIQKVVNLQNSEISLEAFQKIFKEYWSANADESNKKPLEAYIYKFFPSDHLGDVKIINYKKAEEKFEPQFIEELNRRIDWEISSEFGYNAVLGRTLEKTGSSATYFKSEDLDLVYSHIRPWLTKESMPAINKDEFIKFLNVFLHRLRIRGGIDHPYLNNFRTLRKNGTSDYYQIKSATNKKYFLIRNFGKKTRLPKFISDDGRTTGVFDLTLKQTPSTNWFHTYFKKSFPLASQSDLLINEFYSHLLKLLSSADVNILDEKSADGVRNFALNHAKLFIKKQVVSYKCDVCDHELNIADIDSLEGASCINFRCKGHYHLLLKDEAENYYRQVYNRSRSPRIYATEHTGLLERADREMKEFQFKQRPFFNSLNALVATSTLEMGINIGDLNTTLNNSIPPLPSNFIQRVGRAGRSSGSALIVNFASNEAHDQYYYQEPKEMMQGEVNSPGCYLEAKEILKRHFFAFCIDDWTKSNHIKNSIPTNFGFIPFKIEDIDLNDQTLFFNRIISFIKAQEGELYKKFIIQLTEHVSKETLKELYETIRSGQLYSSIVKEFQDVQDEVKALRVKQKQIKKQLDESNWANNDEEKELLDREHKNMGGAILSIVRRSVLEHLTNVGLLPNYAFPETGVTLNAQVRNRNLTGVGDNSYSSKGIELIRPAKSALRELVPENYFYTQGYKLKISGLNIISWKEEVLNYRFCSKCDNLEIDSGQLGSCPKCDDLSWGSANNKHKFNKLKAVKSFNDEAIATLDDTNEEREQKISNVTTHFKFETKSTQGAYAMVKIPFGIEYLKEVDIYQINTGLSEYSSSRELIINENKVPIQGYVTCKHCGKSSSNPFEEKRHYVWCKKKDHDYESKSDDVFEEIYLFRQLKTEAIKVLLPVQEFDSESTIAMFKSGIELGLKRYYKGNPQHIEIKDYKEYNKQTLRTDRFIVLFDVIPGGTGYLSKLFDKEQFSELIENAYKAIKECSCQFSGKDGCYRCIYTYGNQFEREELSRERAEELFRRLYDAREKWDYIPDGLNDITNSGKIEESELEERFIRGIKNYTSQEEQQLLGWDFQTITIDGVNTYKLKIINGATEFYYSITPQVNLGRSEGVLYPTRTDHMITCIDVKKNGESIKIEDLQRIPSIAVYLDGYQYHANKESNRFIGDIQKRISIVDTGRYLTWTLTWEDLNHFEAMLSKLTPDQDNLYHKIKDYNANYLRLQAAPNYRTFDDKLKTKRNNLDRLIYVLSNLDSEPLLNGKITKQLLFGLQGAFLSISIKEEKAKELLTQSIIDFSKVEIHQSEDSYLLIDGVPVMEDLDFKLFMSLKTHAIISKIEVPTLTTNYNKKSWENFWTLFNWMQFGLSQFDIRLNANPTQSSSSKEETVEDILKNFDPTLAPIVKELLAHNIEFNRDSYFSISDENGGILAEALLGIPHKKIFLEPLGDDSRLRFIEKGFKELSIIDFNVNDLI